MSTPLNLKYTKDHEWVLIENDIATIGITNFAQGELGDIVYVEVDTVGEKFDAEEVFGSVEAVKTVSDLFLPVKVNDDPYGEGWMIKVKISDSSEIDNLMSAEEYKKMIGE